MCFAISSGKSLLERLPQKTGGAAERKMHGTREAAARDQLSSVELIGSSTSPGLVHRPLTDEGLNGFAIHLINETAEIVGASSRCAASRTARPS